LFDDRLAYGARAVKMASTVVIGAIFLRMIAVGDKRLNLTANCKQIFCSKLNETLDLKKEKFLLSP